MQIFTHPPALGGIFDEQPLSAAWCESKKIAAL